MRTQADVANGVGDGSGLITDDDRDVPVDLHQLFKEFVDRAADKELGGYDLRLISSVNDVSGIPTEGKSLIIVVPRPSLSGSAR